MSVLDLIDKLGAQESSFCDRTFVSPVYGNTVVATRLERMLYPLTIPKNLQGWYNFQPVDSKRAKVVGPAELSEVEEYLKCLTKIRVVLVKKEQGLYMGIPDKANSLGLEFGNLMPVYLCDDIPLDFDRIVARYDGDNLWYESIDPINDPSKGDYLRESLTKGLSLEKIKYSGLTLEEKHAYALRVSFDKRFVEDRKKDTIKDDVEFAGGRFVRFDEKSDHYSVMYSVDGQQFVTRITKDPRRMVISAGLCLAGDDRKFDLKSLVTVIREAQRKRLVHIV